MARKKPVRRWVELQQPELPILAGIPKNLCKRFGEGKLLIPSLEDVAAIIRSVPKGKLITEEVICGRMAKRHRAQAASPTITAFLVRIVAYDAEAELAAGKKKVPPYWRVIGHDGNLNDKFPGGFLAQSKKLMLEGHALTGSKRAKEIPPRVDDFTKALVKL